jgi:hypothetical protein
MVVEQGVDRDLLMESSWVTPSCDIVTLSVERGERVYELTREVSQLMRAKYFGQTDDGEQEDRWSSLVPPTK